MKTGTIRRQTNASVLLATICATVIVAVALIGYLHMSTHQQKVTARSQVWNLCLPFAEAGVEEALTHCYLDFTAWASQGWNYNAGSRTYFKTNALPQGYYHVGFTEYSPHLISSTGYMRLPATSGHLSRALRVVNNQNVIFKKAINVRGRVDMNGNNVQTDSYDSSDTSKSSGMKYDPTKAGDKGDIVCSNMVNVGNADVWGHVITPPAAGLNVGPNGSVGSLSWHAAGTLGLEAGWWTVSTNFEYYPNVKAPFTKGLNPKSGWVGAIYYDQIFDKGEYVVSGMAGNVLVRGEAVVYSIGSVGTAVTIQNTASLQLYVRGTSCNLSAINNPNIYAGTCVVYGLPTC